MSYNRNILCPHCNTAALVRFDEFLENDIAYGATDEEKLCVWSINCPQCRGVVVFLDYVEFRINEKLERVISEVHKSQIIFPKELPRTIAPEIPEPFRTDFLEAASIVGISPKASAALSRRILQMVMHSHFNIKGRDLSKEIETFISTIPAPTHLKEDIDAIRQVGNFAAHPMKIEGTGQIADVEPGEAEWLLDTLESLFDFAFVQPERSEVRRNKLNAKLKEIGKPPMK